MRLGKTRAVMAVARHPWYFETDTPRDALEGRRLLERYLIDHCEDGDIYSASLIFGELISNVVKHAPRGGVRVWLEPAGKRFALCINDSGKGFDERHIARKPDARSESGRGLFIVRQFSEDLSFRRLDGGFMVRAVLPLRRR
jgi:anti-sigma regulatory factor (Ser/Thr protein kinase)